LKLSRASEKLTTCLALSSYLYNSLGAAGLEWHQQGSCLTIQCDQLIAPDGGSSHGERATTTARALIGALVGSPPLPAPGRWCLP
jgi:hypothetical protein